ncbi:MAG: DUF5627 domain-containing protein [Prevotella sp.]|jgi:hypothetical protein|nr:DUF5627 domain-containing protein [Prevotella sp.]MCI1281911.1 DUF5627 domain-containing protein [Prevotella sp.]
MKIKNIILVLLAGTSVVALQSCKNESTDFDDYDYTTTYFSYQNPIRTLVLGNNEEVDVTLDNAHKCQIYAVLGGSRSGKDVSINIMVDTTLCNNLYFSDGTKVKPMPSAYYSLLSDQILIKNDIKGCVDVQFTDAFFADKDALKNTYVIPVVMKNVVGADSILRGQALFNNPIRTRSTDWATAPKDYVLYLVKYICPWAGKYLRRGVDVSTTGSNVTTSVRHKQYVERDEVFTLTTNNLSSVLYPFNSSCNLLLTFDTNGNCVVSSASKGYTATGTGTFVDKGAKLAWGNKDRDVMYLDYKVQYGNTVVATKDTLVARDRGVSGTAEEFTAVYKE